MPLVQRNRIRRRELLLLGASIPLAGVSGLQWANAAESLESNHGFVVGEPTAEKVGSKILADGGNAVDALVAAALAAAVAAPHQTGMGGYGAHGLFAVNGGTRVFAIDANGAAPAAMRPDVFQPDQNGNVPGRINEFGWLAAVVPGILAGLQLALDRFGTKSFREMVQPAIGLARDGITWPATLTSTLQAGAAQFQRDPGSKQLYFPDDRPIAAGTRFKNPALAEMLGILAQANSTEPFYRGEIAERIAAEFQKHGGLVTIDDLKAYRARLVEPLALELNGSTIQTAPPSSGGLTVLQVLQLLKALKWVEKPVGAGKTHLLIEATRLAWRDRLRVLGDVEFSGSPAAKLLSAEYAHECAAQINDVVTRGTYLPTVSPSRDHGGTIHLSAADKQGNFAALTLTHGNSFGARVTVDGLGLTLGHGMSRFDPRPGHPNAPGPGKRPLHNMVPTIVSRDGKAVLAVGGRGGRKIPNAMTTVLSHFTLMGPSIQNALNAPRFHTEGNVSLEFEAKWPSTELESLRGMGYQVKTAGSATISAVAYEQGELRTKTR